MSDSRKYKVIISDKAKNMLGAHIRFTAQISKEAAEKIRESLITALNSLSQMPQRNPFFNGTFIPHNKYHKMLVEKRYLIIYQIQDDTAAVDYILDCRSDYDWLVH